MDLKRRLRSVTRERLQVAGVFLLLLLAVFLLWFNNRTSMQAQSAMVAQVYFDGEYRIEGGEWHKIVPGEHISATKGDVTLRGNFHMRAPNGEYVGVYRGDLPVAFYVDHINLTFYETGCEPFVMDVENPLYGDSSCCVSWTAYLPTSESEELIEILVHNPHTFGNETAIDEMLTKMAFWTGIEFEREVMNQGENQRIVGILLILVSLVFLGTALFSHLIHVKNGKIIWMLGLVVLFAGIYFSYSADGVAFWSASTVSNTTILGASMMFYMLFVFMIIVGLLRGTKWLGNLATMLLSVANAVFFLLPVLTDVLFYDTWPWWINAQLVASVVLSFCLIKEFIASKNGDRWLYAGAFLPLLSFAADAFGTHLGFWRGGVASRYVFIVLFAVAAIMVLKLIPGNINAAAKAKELEMERIVLNAELSETRISTMMSQIRPHFIYNTLGSIEQLCELDPPKAGKLVHDFAKYLRGNFGELDNPKPILMSKEMDHVHHYVSIENVRFPDMTVTFDMNAPDFQIPALTVQPIVENAIKHGLMKLEKGGSIHVASFETETEYCVSVEDDGVGFDTTLLLDDRKHVGLRNIRERLKAMVDGTMEIESKPGEGTRVLIHIPKEGKK